MPETQKCLARYQNSTVIVIEPHPHCNKDDGTRMMSTLQELQDFTSKMKEILSQHNIPYKSINDTNVEIPDLQVRVNQVLSFINKL